MIAVNVNRVPQHTSELVNEKIRRKTGMSFAYFKEHPEEIGQRLAELDEEWDIEGVAVFFAHAARAAGGCAQPTVDFVPVDNPGVLSAACHSRLVSAGWYLATDWVSHTGGDRAGALYTQSAARGL